jgi:NADH-quinone oxidoreductase subunit J
MGEQIAFWICAVLAVLGALGMVLSKKAVHSALFVANTMINLAVLYAFLDAAFLSLVQIIVYTGAVMMLFLFVLMIVGVDATDSLVETIKGQRIVAVIAAIGLGGLMTSAIGAANLSPAGLVQAKAEFGGNLQGLAKLIFGDYLLAFEVTSALLITAALGAMVLAHRERFVPRPTQRDLSIARFKSPTGYKGSLPAAGTYARHNAVDTPALLPDGTMAEISVPKPLTARGSLRAVDTADQAEVEALASGEAVVVESGDQA